MKALLSTSFVLLALSVHAAAMDQPADRDGDGIRDDHEEILGSNASQAEVFHLVRDDGLESDQARARETYDPSKDLITIEFAHVGDDRYLWRATFPVPPRLEDTVFHLYVDADADAATGRKGPDGAASTGTEYMLSVVGGRGTSGYYDGEGVRASGPLVSSVVDGNTLIVSADVELGREAGNIRYDLYVLCHTTTESGQGVRMSDSTGKGPVQGVPVVDRRKYMRPRDHSENFRVAASFGPEPIRATLAAEGTLVVPHDQLELDGFIVDPFTTRRWPHVRSEGSPATVSTLAPKAGRYHVGFMMYDDASDERIVFSVNGETLGVAVANQNNNRTWLYWLEEPYEFQGGERVELAAAGPSGRHGIVNILFLAEAPQSRAIQYQVENLTSATHVGQAGRVTVSWTTTWPCPTRFQHGTDTNYGRSVETEAACLVHRVVLEGLDAEGSYHGRAIATAPDGSEFPSDDFLFQAAPPPAPATRSGVHSVSLSVGNPHAFAVHGWPVTGGVPFPEGVLGNPAEVRLTSNEKEIPAQISLAARWPDGSVKWILVSFLADAPAGAEAEYHLEFGADVRRQAVEQAISLVEDAEGVAIDTGALRFRINPQGNLRDFATPEGALLTAPDSACRSVAVDADGNRYQTGLHEALLEVEESGPLRVVVKVTSHLADASGGKLMRIEKRVEAYPGAASLRIHHTFIVEGQETFTRLRELSYQVPVDTSAGSWLAPLVDGEPLVLNASAPTVRQRFDDEFVLGSSDGETNSTGRIVGAIVAEGAGGCAVAVRDFWQNYPKAFSLSDDGLHVDLCPPFEAGLYDAFPFEKEGHQLYYYLLDGQYRLKRGVSKTHELFLCFEPQQRRAESCAVFQRPLLLTPSPQWSCDSKAFYSVAVRDTERFQLYEAAIDKNLVAYAEQQRRQHDFGMLNYGDWYGERGSNWGNIEYDTQHAFFLEYIRSGNPAAFFLGQSTQLHNRDVDTVQWSENPDDVGAVYVHQMCHVGQYYDKSVPGTLGFPRGGYTVSHAWTEGHFDHYFLSGDRRSYETGCAVADFFIRKELGRPYDFSSTRTPGWHLIMLAAAYAATDDPYYLNAAKVIVEYVLETQDVEPRPLGEYQAEGRQPYQVGGWSRMMVPGHCQCEPRHRGNAGFMIAVLLSGLKYYHDVTGDERVKQAIIRGAHYLVEETYSDEVHGFRYTSCPNTGYRAGASPLMVEGIARAYLWTGDERFRRVLTEALPVSAGGSPYGKSFSMYYRMAPRVLADMAEAGIHLNQPAPVAE